MSEEGCSLGVMIKVELHNKFSKTKPVTKFTFVNFYICSRAMLFLLLDVIGCQQELDQGSVLVSFPLYMIKYSEISNFSEKGFI